MLRINIRSPLSITKAHSVKFAIHGKTDFQN